MKEILLLNKQIKINTLLAKASHKGMDTLHTYEQNDMNDQDNKTVIVNQLKIQVG